MTKDEDLKCLIAYAFHCYKAQKSLEPLAIVASKMIRELAEIPISQDPGISVKYRDCIFCHKRKEFPDNFPIDSSGEPGGICSDCLNLLNESEP